MSNGMAAVVAVIGGLLALAALAVVFGKNAQTGEVLKQGGSALSAVIAAAVQPVS